MALGGNQHLISALDRLIDIKTNTNADDRLVRRQEPVSPEVFLTSRYYSGFGPGDLYPFWVEQICDFINNDYNELIITGSIGSGKTTAANLLLLYKFYEILCWEDPNAFLGLPAMQEIYNIYFSVSGKQAERTGYRQFRSMVDSAGWFKDNDPRRAGIDSVCEFRDGKFQLFAGSSPQHAIGMTVWSTILDEADFYKKSGHAFDETYEAVTDLYEELADRRTSRFQKHGKDLSFSILISSATFQSSFVARRIQESAYNPRIKVVNAVSYNIKPAGTYSKTKFYVFKGHKLADPEILRDKHHLNEILRKLRISYQTKHALGRAYEYLPPRVKELIEPVPEDFRSSFERNIHKALMNHSGVATARVGKLFQSRALLSGCYDESLAHPFIKQEVELSTADDIALKDYFLPGNLIDIDKPHAIHIDQSVSGDATGISMVRFDGTEQTKDGIHVRRYTHVFSIRIVPPPPPATIKISKSREFVLWLRDYGVNIVRVTMDQYQSRDSMQILSEKGIKAEYQSLDRKDDAYLAWMNILQDRAIRMYYYKPLEDEALDAVHDRRRRKVDHPKTGTIDVLQSFVGALYSLVCTGEMHTEVDTSFMDSIDERSFDPFGMPVVGVHDTLHSAYLSTRTTMRSRYLKDIL